MATLQKRTNGGWELQYKDEHHQKQTITLSGRKYKERIVQQLKEAVEVLVDKKINNDPRQDPTVKAWIEHAPPEIQRKLTRLGLYDLSSKRTVKDLWDTFIAKRTDVAESTTKTYLGARARFFLFFKENELVGRLTQERMKEWKAYLLDCGKFGEPTVTGTISRAKVAFNWAKQQKWITESPLDGVTCGSWRNETQDYFVTREQYRQLLEACPSQEWRVIIALVRIGGLHPCEVQTLRWSDIDKATHRFMVLNAKLKRFKRLYKREVPLFPELVEELDKLRLDPQDNELVVNRPIKSWFVQFTQIAERAGVGKIPRPFDNMRASRATEVHDRYGAKRESLWIGHSEKIAEKFYLMVTDDDFAIAAGKMTMKSAIE